MIRIAICDDEPVMMEQLQGLLSARLQHWQEPFLIDCYSGGEDLLAASFGYDVLFLDIEMQGLDGVTLARKLRRQGWPGLLLFVTILTACMPDAFEVEAADYLCKPIDEARLERTLERVRKRLLSRRERSLLIQTASWCRTVRYDEIWYCEVINRKLYLHTKTGVLDYYGRMKEAESQLCPPFVKCHRSYLVNPAWVCGYADGQLTLENGERIPVSRQLHSQVMEAILQYMAGRS